MSSPDKTPRETDVSPHTDTQDQDTKKLSPKDSKEAESHAQEESDAQTKNTDIPAKSESEPIGGVGATQDQKQKWQAKIINTLKDKNTLTLIIALMSLGLSLLSVVLILCNIHEQKGYHHDREHRGYGYMQDAHDRIYQRSDIRGYSDYEPSWYSDMREHMRAMESMRASLEDSTSQIMVRSQNNSITRSLLSEINGQVTGTLSFTSESIRDQAADRLKKAGITIEKIGTQDLRLESDKGLGFVQRVLQSR